ncbi:H-2 class I histocompatibility antigen, Q9 alpha chain-like [Melanotaenia boesemani]|uniref:H-2 class I histocompatibility antigen, Q9 alpha chain-like n=1 Tax=Melanotaenia boesemani TaxID=1250792 RepID=UPI001C05BDCF|nr:H-2 class I histocompatibility antigen, Q9 alpha chain-like [Melanotaenia boesemani]
MKSLMFFVLLGIQSARAAFRSLKYFYTASSQVRNFPEFVAVGFVDDVQMIHFDSDSRRVEPKQDWMRRVSEDDPQYLPSETDSLIGAHKLFIANIETAKKRFNRTEGVHIYQWMYGCDWDDDTGQVEGYDQHGYDGEDFVALDLKTESWIAAAPQAVITKHKLDSNKALIAQKKNYLHHICPEWLKKYVNYGRSSLMRTVHPSVSFLQKTSSSPVTCHATGFYPKRAELFWRKDGAEIHEGVNKGQILPNNDGTFQMSVNLDLSLVGTKDWTKYECVFQLSGAQDIVHPLEKTKIKTNYPNSNIMIIPIIVAVVVLSVIAVIGFILYKKKNAKRPPCPVDSTEVPDQMIQLKYL